MSAMTRRWLINSTNWSHGERKAYFPPNIPVTAPGFLGPESSQRVEKSPQLQLVRGLESHCRELNKGGPMERIAFAQMFLALLNGAERHPEHKKTAM